MTENSVSDVPIVEFWSADKVEYRYIRGVLKEVVFRSEHKEGDRLYHLEECYGKGYIESRLYDNSGHEVRLDSVPCLSGIETRTIFDGDYIMAVPLKFYASKNIRTGVRAYSTAVNPTASTLWTRLFRSGGTP